jgi:precorrin-6B methylase 2
MLKNILRSNRFTSGLLEVYFVSKKYLIPKGWFISRYLHQSIDKNKKPLPWFTYPSIHFINTKLRLSPISVFEFGSGNSTLWFSSRVKDIISVENDAEYYAVMEKKFNLKGNITYHLRNLKDNYNSLILEYENQFDIIVIDGRERVKCTKNCLKALKPKGILIFDNSEREQYQEAYNFLDQNGFKKIDFIGLGPIGHSEWQTTIYYRSNNCFEI